MDLLEKAKAYFKEDRFAMEAAGITIEEVGADYARCEMKIKPIHQNAAGGVMGGALFTLADFCFAVAANMGGVLTVSMTSQITYLNKAKGSVLTASAHCEKNGRRTCFYTITIEDDLGITVAIVSTTGMHQV